MARILGIDLDKNKTIDYALTKIFGINISKSKTILKKCKINLKIKVKDLDNDQINLIRQELNNHNLEGNLRKEIGLNIKRLMEIGCYRGIRHKKHLPVNGQRTRSNARTRKGPKKTVANKKKPAMKT